MRSVAALLVLLASAPALADPAPACQTYDRAPACCHHPPPRCCDPSLRQLLPTGELAAACKAKGGVRGEAETLGRCDTFVGGEIIGRVSVERRAASGDAFATARRQATEQGARVHAIAVAGADEAFVAERLEDGKATVVTAVARIGGVLLTVEAEAEAGCEVPALLEQATRRVRALQAKAPRDAARG